MYEKELEIALKAVADASELCTDVRRTLVSEETIAKKDKSPVTVADFGVQALINHRLISAFPGDPIVAEETADALREDEALCARVAEFVQKHEPGLAIDAMLDAIDRGNHAGGKEGRFWTLDPIDGTKGFIRGDQYAIALALIENGQVVLGVLGGPNLPIADVKGFLGYAVKGQGARASNIEHPTSNIQHRSIHVSTISNASDAAFCESVESGHTSHGASARVAEVLGVQVEPARIDSQCKYAVVARGEASIYLRLPTRPGYEEKIWDHAAGSILVKEAGGQVSDIYGKPLDFSKGRTLCENKGVVATNGLLHPAVIEAIGKVGL